MDSTETYDGYVPPPWDENDSQPVEEQPHETTRPDSRSLKLTWANTIAPAPVVWAWRDASGGRIPAGSLSIAAGREGTGKSSYGIWMAAHVTQGTLPGSLEGRPKNVFYLAVEDSWKHTLVPRLLAAGANVSKVARLDVITTDDDDGGTLSLPLDNRRLEAAIMANDVGLVVLDPVMSLISNKIDTHREREVRSALDPLAKMADRTGCVFLGIAHFNKGSGTDTASLITGSGAFKNVPRTIFGFARDESEGSNERVMTQVKNSLGSLDLPSLSYVIESAEIPTNFGIAETGLFTFIGESDRSVSDFLRDSRNGDEDDDRNMLDAWLTDYITSEGGSAKAKDVLNAGRSAGFAESSIKKARMRLKIGSDRVGFGKGSYIAWTIGSHIGAIGSQGQKVESMEPMEESMQDPTCIKHGIPFVDGACLACESEAL